MVDVAWALISLDGVAPSRMVSVSASVNLPLHHKVQKFLAPAHPGGPEKRVVKWLWWWWCAGMVIFLEQGANDLHMVLLMPLPPNHLLLQ